MLLKISRRCQSLIRVYKRNHWGGELRMLDTECWSFRLLYVHQRYDFLGPLCTLVKSLSQHGTTEAGRFLATTASVEEQSVVSSIRVLYLLCTSGLLLACFRSA